MSTQKNDPVTPLMVAGIICTLIIANWMLVLFNENAAAHQSSEYKRLNDFLIERKCTHTGYGPDRSSDKVYVCDVGTYMVSGTTINRAE